VAGCSTANPWGVDDLTVLDFKSDHYGNAIMRLLSAFPIETYGDPPPRRGDHLRLYGVFLKNFTHEKKQAAAPGTGYKHQPLTMPLFVVFHARPVRPGEGSRGLDRLIYVVSGLIVVFTLAFWFLVIRRSKAEEVRMDEHRRRLRRRALGLGERPARAPAAEGPVDREQGPGP
jgi:hypothetical protein